MPFLANFVVMKLRMICLRSVRYSDTRSILTGFSRERGRVSVSVPSGHGRTATRLRALTMPLSVIDVETGAGSDHREILTLRSASPAIVAPMVVSDPSRSTQAVFLAEVLGAVLRQSEEDSGVFGFVEQSVRVLDALPASGVGMFHIIFLSALTRLLGIEPDVSTFGADTGFFDMREGVWRKNAPVHPDFLEAAESRGAYILSRCGYDAACRLRWSRDMRRRALDLLLRYYSIHIAPLASLKSLDVLRSMVG